MPTTRSKKRQIDQIDIIPNIEGDHDNDHDSDSWLIGSDEDESAWEDESDSDEELGSLRKSILENREERAAHQQKDVLDKIKSIDSTAYENMKDVLGIINSKNPNIMEILKTPMRQKDRAEIIELYEVFKTAAPSTEEWLELRFKINFFMKKYEENFREYSKHSETEIADLKAKSRSIKKEITPEFAIKYKILTLNTSDANKAVIYKKYRQFKHTSPSDEERTKLKAWLDCALALPHDNVLTTVDFTHSVSTTLFMQNVIKSLNEELYGMAHVKEQLLLFLNSKLTNPNMKGCSLALVGPPGVGKTTIARYLAQVMQWPFEQISFGGANSSDFLKGHDYTYIGSKPGEIARSLSRMKHKNGILFLDEYEKVAENKDIASCLLHITDFQQNHEFRDNYLSDLSIDLSRLWFIYSMNDLPSDAAICDRLFIINVPSYKIDEKIHILKDFVIPKALKNIGRDPTDIIMTEEVAKHIVVATSLDDSGIRRIEQIAKDLVNKLNFIIINQASNGKLPEIFNFMSFSSDEHCIDNLNYPVTLSIDIFDILFKSIKTKTSLPFGMYT